MPQVDFYILPTDDPDARIAFACKLVEKAWRLGHRIHLHCQDEHQRQAVDERLWRFKGESFIPHDYAECAPEDRADVVLGIAEPPDDQQDLLINLSSTVPPAFERFARVAEIVVEEPSARQAARQAFRFYREHGYPLQDHRLTRF